MGRVDSGAKHVYAGRCSDVVMQNYAKYLQNNETGSAGQNALTAMLQVTSGTTDLSQAICSINKVPNFLSSNWGSLNHIAGVGLRYVRKFQRKW